MDASLLVRPLLGAADNAGGMVDNVVAAVADDAVRANPFSLAPLIFDDIDVAAGRVDEVVGRIETLIAQHGDGTLDDAAQAATKDARIGVHRLNKDVQARLEPHFTEGGLDAAITSRIKQADATLEDLGWQLAKKPAPDGRFNGIDLPGALRDGRTASEILRKLVPRSVAAAV